jgi:hypothetical protein
VRSNYDVLVRKGFALEKWARVIMLAAAITVVVSVLLPWKYEDAFPNITEPHWSRGIDLDFVPTVPILGIVTLVLGLLRRYEGVTAFGILGAILTYAMIGLLAAGWLGEPDEPEDVGAARGWHSSRGSFSSPHALSLGEQV